MTYTLTLNESQIESLIKTYQSYHVPDNNNYTLFRAKIKSSTLTIYKTHKILIQGNIERQTVDLQNVRFGKLIAKEKTDKRNNDGRVIWNCLCDCGNWIEADSHSLQ